MGKFIDETGNKYGSLTVLYKAETEKGKPIKWHCLCECGSEKDILGTMLRNGNTKSCGCLQRKRAAESNIERTGGSILGQRFNRLVVIEEYMVPQTNGKNQRFCKCKCDCGNISEIAASHLKSGHTQSCGCLNKEIVSEQTIIREEGNRYGKLTVVEEYGRDKNNRILWRCLCDCGNEKIALGKTLRAGLCNSCGCLKSRGEERTNHALSELGIDFKQEYVFEELCLNQGWPLRFDFAIFDNKKVVALIECQGEQHYKKTSKYYSDTLFLRDKMKKDFCKEKGIPLIEIPYSDYDKIDSDYLRRVMKL